LISSGAVPIILYVITRPVPGGAQSHLLELLRGLRGGFSLHVATGEEGHLTSEARLCGASVHLVPGLTRAVNPLLDLRAVRECLDLVRALRPDIVHTHSSKAGVAGRIAARVARVPCVHTVHGWGFKPGAPAARRYLALAAEGVTARLASRIVCVSSHDAVLAERYRMVDPSRVVTIRNGISPVAPIADPSVEPATAIMTARFQEPKDHRCLLRAFKEAAWQHPSARLHLVGNGPELAACRELVREMGLGDRVVFLGERFDVPALLSQSQVFVLASRHEGLPISILEAMRAGLPVVATGVGGIPEAVENGVTGLLTPRGDASALASALGALLADSALRARMGASGRQRFLRHFTADRMVGDTRAIYNELLEERQHARS